MDLPHLLRFALHGFAASIHCSSRRELDAAVFWIGSDIVVLTSFCSFCAWIARWMVLDAHGHYPDCITLLLFASLNLAFRRATYHTPLPTHCLRYSPSASCDWFAVLDDYAADQDYTHTPYQFNSVSPLVGFVFIWLTGHSSVFQFALGQSFSYIDSDNVGLCFIIKVYGSNFSLCFG